MGDENRPLLGAKLRVVGGVAVGDEEAPAVWEDEREGVARLLRGVAEFEPDCVAVVCGKHGGEMTVFSNFDTAEGTIGFLQRGSYWLDRWVLGQKPPADDA
jgi:hypothetical protein